MADSPVPETAPLVSDDKIKETKIEITLITEEPKDEVKEEIKEEVKEETIEEAKDDDKEEKKQFNISDNILPKDYVPAQRLSIAQTAKVPAYDHSRQISKVQMKEMKQQINNMTEALIADPKEAIRRFTVDATIEEEKYDPTLKNVQEAKSDKKFKSHFHTKKKLDPLTPVQVILGCAPLIFIICIVIFGLIVYGIAQGAGKNKSAEPGPFGDWPNWGGNLQNQQRAATSSMINTSNIDTLAPLCAYLSEAADPVSKSGASGFIATDKHSKNGYFVDGSGYVSSINLESCELNWKTKISSALNTETVLISRNGVALYRDSKANKAVLIGTPNGDSSPTSTSCYVLSLRQSDGSKLFSLELSVNGNAKYCMTDGFIVDGQYAYGGVYTSSSCNDPVQADGECSYRGEVVKIDLDNRKVIDRWYSLPEESGYYGAPPMNYPAIIGDYLVIGTGALFGNPTNVDQCLSGDFSKVTSSKAYNPCGQNRSTYASWRCYEDDINVDAINVLNKTTFSSIASLALSGNDVSRDVCNLYTGISDANICPSRAQLGPGADVSAQAAYSMNDNIFSAVLTKSGMFYVFELPMLELKWAKKIGPAGFYGGGLYSLAIDADNYIAIASITGLKANYRYPMSDGTNVCGTGFVEAIDLSTGESLWQFVNPFGVYDTACDGNGDMYNMSDYSEILGGESCSIAPKITGVVTKVVIPDVSDSRVPMDQYNRANFVAPATISNDLVFIPSNTGDVFVCSVMDGTVLKRLSCRNVFDKNNTVFNRDGLSAGLTVVKDRVVMYCGAGNYDLSSTSGRRVVSYKLT